ncbi:MAG: YqgE/AlgH family protein [Marinicaulis sp.]|nr:YqgE/AlgH family protein [Marinicaulis sp.]NNE40871.1 YqgE/AlgH family protein [Marinicaulis sp.]NNL90576.1 YqgE/AlgH family protein [Marinicaulis sp.]
MGDEGKSASENGQDFLNGQLLIAMPNMTDPRFERAVVFICSHDRDHAMGVIVNKRIDDLHLIDLLEQLEIKPGQQADETPIFFGGPVQTERGLVIHTLDYKADTTLVINDQIGLTATKEILVDIGGKEPPNNQPERYLLAIGHAGWGAGQLEQEIAMNAWLHCSLDEAIIFEGAESSAWNRALKKLGVSSAMFSPEWAAVRDDDQPLN